ncbi:hypothetical protein ES703_20843 [subsurface metagenome]
MAEEKTREENPQQPEIKIKDRKLVEVAYPSGRRVRYHYNHLLSEMQLPLILPPREPED